MRRRYRAVPHVLIGLATACGPAHVAAPKAKNAVPTTSAPAPSEPSAAVEPENEAAAPRLAATAIGPTTTVDEGRGEIRAVPAPSTTIPANSVANGPLPVVVAETLACIRAHESDTAGGYGAVSADGDYRGAYQFDDSTWAGVGGQGDPAAASPDEQDRRAADLLARRGTQPWGGVC